MKNLTYSIGFAALLAAPSAAQATLEGLGFLPNQMEPSSEAHAISDDGRWIVGQARRPGELHDDEAFLWSAATGMIGLGTLSGHADMASAATAISGDGRVLAGMGDAPPIPFQNQARVGIHWTRRTGMHPLAGLPFSRRPTIEDASFDGEFTVGHSHHSGNGVPNHLSWDEATLWHRGVPEGLGFHPGAHQSKAMGVSGDGRVVVGFADRSEDEGRTAFRWTESLGLESLGDVPGGYHFSEAHAANADGSVIVGMTTDTFQTSLFSTDSRASVWTEAGGWEVLQELPQSGVSTAVAVSPNGRFIAGRMRRFGTTRPVVWRDGVALDVVETVENAGVDMSDWLVLEVADISADGHVVVGYGHRVSAPGREAFRAYLP